MSTTRGQHLIGKVIGGCTLERLIGYGGSSAVFLAQPLDSGEKVAVKVFLPRSTMDTQSQKSFYRRFLREAQAASGLDHPHILSIYSYGEHEGLPYIVMPYIRGGTLSEYVGRHGPLSLRVAQSYLEQIAEALDYAHDCGCVHCDVKPANILLDIDGQVVLSDFGIVRLLDGASLSAKQSTKSPEELIGTPDYISPEQALGEALDGRSDIYSLGVTLFYLLAGSPPFKSDSTIAMALMHVHDEPPLLGLQRADVTPQIDQVIHKALAKWPEERYQTAGAFSDAFSEAVSHVDNIDKVALVNRPPDRRAAGNANGNGILQAPAVRVMPLSAVLPGMRSRPRLLVAIVSALLIVALAITLVFTFASNRHTQKPAITPTPTTDVLASDENAWPSGSTFFFTADHSYHIVNKSSDTIAIALCQSHVYSNFDLKVTTNEQKGSRNSGDYYGVILRSALDQSHYYMFEVSAFDNGRYLFTRTDNAFNYLTYGNVASFRETPGQSNVIEVKAMGNTFTFFVNGIQLGKAVSDTLSSPFTAGEVGLSVEQQNTEVAFSKMSVSSLS